MFVKVMRLNLEVENKAILCENYEKQMQRVQEQLLREIEDKDFAIDRLKSDIIKLEVMICYMEIGRGGRLRVCHDGVVLFSGYRRPF